MYRLQYFKQIFNQNQKQKIFCYKNEKYTIVKILQHFDELSADLPISEKPTGKKEIFNFEAWLWGIAFLGINTQALIFCRIRGI